MICSCFRLICLLSNRRKTEEIPLEPPTADFFPNFWLCCFGASSQYSDDERQEEKELRIIRSDVLNDKYQVLSKCGEGTFGSVIKCLNIEKNEMVAVKIMKKGNDSHSAMAKAEIKICNEIKRLDPEGKSGCVRLLDSFIQLDHYCLVFEPLGLSVYDLLKKNKWKPFPIHQIKVIGYQICHSVKFLHDHNLTHTDLKPENILFIDSNFELVDEGTSKNSKCYRMKRPIVKLIDFGNAIFDDDHHNAIISTRLYRAPEVILKLGWKQPSDVWSIGCIIFELFNGTSLFKAATSLEHLEMMEKILGIIPQNIKNMSTTEYFLPNGRINWEIKKVPSSKLDCKPLKDFIKFRNDDYRHLYDLIINLLEYDPELRMSLKNALHHPFHKGVTAFLKQFYVRK